MSGLWLEAESLRLRSDLPVPQPAAGEALVRVRRAGVCGTDQALVRGYARFVGVPGHEFVGDVVVGPDHLLGRRVVGDINVGCGDCRRCLDAVPNHCARRRVLGIRDLNGAFAEYLVLPSTNLVPVPEELSDGMAALAEPLAAALHIGEQVDLLGRRLLIVGDGCLGQLVARALAPRVDRVTLIGRHRSKLDRLSDLAIATTTDAAETDGEFDIAVECSGDASGFATALAALRPQGTLVVKSTYLERQPLDLTPLVVGEIRLVGSRCGSIASALQALRERPFAPEAVVDAVYPLHRALDAFRRARQPGVLKVQIVAD